MRDRCGEKIEIVPLLVALNSRTQEFVVSGSEADGVLFPGDVILSVVGFSRRNAVFLKKKILVRMESMPITGT